jgi:hypothetical protein
MKISFIHCPIWIGSLLEITQELPNIYLFDIEANSYKYLENNTLEFSEFAGATKNTNTNAKTTSFKLDATISPHDLLPNIYLIQYESGFLFRSLVTKPPSYYKNGRYIK